MAFVVVLCPACKRALITDPDHETTTCNRCDKRVQLDEMRIFHRTGDHDEAVRFAGALNARQAGDLDAYLDQIDDPDPDRAASPLDRAVRTAKRRSGEVERVRAGAVALAGDQPVTEARMAQLLHRLDVDPGKAADYLEKFTREGDLYEPTPGRYRPLE